ncbi:hypothetical protein Micbo1qcDRAFT_155809 [Microdochium bolleyi]|uniref:4-coumarate:coenzyme A ligase n=1 Tax=Microdochium bolleyi TaxID=196109 RepID=A0A136JIS8_9PEZI|nr:hypothetical protein Micbo1qcDRAFT_155809 [Microdochium bolleyi]
MPIRIPKARSSEIATFGVAGVAGFAPLYMMMPGAEKRLADQTTKWAPRWEKNISYFAPPARIVAQRASPHVEKTVKKIDDKLPLEKITTKISNQTQRNFDRFEKIGQNNKS